MIQMRHLYDDHKSAHLIFHFHTASKFAFSSTAKKKRKATVNYEVTKEVANKSKCHTTNKSMQGG